MKCKWGMYLYGVFEMFIALGAIAIGVMMTANPNGGKNIIEFPSEWIGRQPFSNWLIPGIVGVVLFGLFNIVAAVYSFIKNRRAGTFGIAMGSILFVSIVIEMLLLGVYLISVELLMLSIVQLAGGTYMAKIFKTGTNALVK